MRNKSRRSNHWMLLVAPAVAAIGTVVGYMLRWDPNFGVHSSLLVWSVTFAIVGLLFIVYTRDYWIQS